MKGSCQCGRPIYYREKCRDCYEDEIRHQLRDAYDQDASVIYKRVFLKDRCGRYRRECRGVLGDKYDD